MNNKILLYLVISLITLILFSCDKMSELDLLNQEINELVDAVEKHDKKDIGSILSGDFLTAKNLNKIQFLFFVNYHFKRNKSISISIINKEIRLNEKYADVKFKVLLLGSNEWLPERGQVYKVTSRWKKEKDNWVMSRLRWEQN